MKYEHSCCLKMQLYKQRKTTKSLSLKQVTDKELLKELEELTDWRQSDREIEEDYLIAYYDGKNITKTQKIKKILYLKICMKIQKKLYM